MSPSFKRKAGAPSRGGRATLDRPIEVVEAAERLQPAAVDDPDALRGVAGPEIAGPEVLGDRDSGPDADGRSGDNRDPRGPHRQTPDVPLSRAPGSAPFRSV
jgi:hypothetical protein